MAQERAKLRELRKKQKKHFDEVHKVTAALHKLEVDYGLLENNAKAQAINFTELLEWSKGHKGCSEAVKKLQRKKRKISSKLKDTRASLELANKRVHELGKSVSELAEASGYDIQDWEDFKAGIGQESLAIGEEEAKSRILRVLEKLNPEL